MKKDIELFDIERLLSDDVEYKKKYVNHRFKILKNLYLLHSLDGERKIELNRIIDCEIKILCNSILDLKLFEREMNQYALELSNLETDKELGIALNNLDKETYLEILKNKDEYIK